jgi:hypothetical protein
MKLDNTIILPEGNTDLSQRLLISLIEREDVVTVIIFGKDAKAEDAVQKADVRASSSPAGIERKVAWMQDTGLIDFFKTLIKQGAGGKPGDISLQKHIGVAISMTDILMDLIPINPAPDFIRMELAFINASKI